MTIRSNGIDKRTMIDAAFWRELMAYAQARGGVQAIQFGDGTTVVYDPVLVEGGGIKVPADLIDGPPDMARGGQQVYTFGGRREPDTLYPPAAQPSPDPAVPHAIPDPGEIDLSVPLRRSKTFGG